MVFQRIGAYKSFTFVNVESGYEEIAKDLGDFEVDKEGKVSLPEEDITQFCLWIKDQMSPYVGKVTLSKRLKGVPAVLFGKVSASMRMMMNMV